MQEQETDSGIREALLPAKAANVNEGVGYFIVHWEVDCLFSPGDVVGNINFSFGQLISAVYANDVYLSHQIKVIEPFEIKGAKACFMRGAVIINDTQINEACKVYLNE